MENREASSVALTTHGIFLKQDFALAYRYLDCCGEFLVRGQRDMDLVPTGDQTPAGGSMEAPNIGVKVDATTTFLRVGHELPSDSGETFRKYASSLSKMYQELFKPAGIERNAVAINFYLPFTELSQAYAESLKWDKKQDQQVELGQVLGMTSGWRNLEYAYVSGSKRLLLKFRPVTFENIRLHKRNAGPNATAAQRKLVQRQNSGMDRIMKTELAHALYVELELSEENPAPNSEMALFEEACEKKAIVAKRYFQ